MADYRVEFIAKIVPSKRTNDLPDEAVHEIFVRAVDFNGLRDAINNEMNLFIQQQGMIVDRTPGELIHDGTERLLDRRIFIPVHMISNISTRTVRLVGEIPDENAEDLLVQ